MLFNMPRILFIAPFIRPAGGTSESTVNAKLVTAGRNAGWDIDVVAEDRQEPSWYPESDLFDGALSDIVTLLQAPERSSLKHLLLRMESQLMLRGIYSLYGNAWVAMAIHKGEEILRTKKFDLIMSRALPDYAHLPALALARKSKLPWIANWNDPVPMRLAPPPYGRGSLGRPPGGWLMSRIRHYSLERFFSAMAKEATRHTFPCERLRDYMGNIIGNPIIAKSCIIPHIAIEGNNVQYSQSRNVFSMCHAGTMIFRDKGIFLEGVRLFLDTVKPTEPIIMTFLSEHSDTLRKAVQSLGLEEIVRIEEAVPYQIAVERIAMASVALIIEAQMREGVFFPSKLVDCIQTGRPIMAVSPLQGTISDLIGRYGGGLVADCNSAESVAKVIGSLYSSWKRGTLDDEYGSSRLLPQFSAKRVIGAYEQLFQTMHISK